MRYKYLRDYNMQQQNKYKLGWIPDTPDFRDIYYSIPSPIIEKGLPESVDLTDKCPPIYNQLREGSCTGNAIAGAIQFDRLKQGLENWTPSRNFIYYNERALENTVLSDSGAMIRDGVKTVNSQGAPPESLWPYDISNFTTKPSIEAYTEAAKHPAVQYQRITNDLDQMKGCLTSGYPFVFGFSVYESMMTQQVADTGILNMPSKAEKMVGGHAVLAIGFCNSTSRFIVRNSWGNEWGNSGYFTMPYDYLTNSNLSDDRWNIRLTE